MTLFDTDDVTPAGPDGPVVRVRMTVAYDGKGFHGFAFQQSGVATVASALQGALGKVLRHPVVLTCAGRTDTGVHAWGQVVSFDARDDVDLVLVQRSVNKQLAPAVVVRDAAVVDPAFDARFDARSREYRYTVVNAPVPDPFRARYAWHVPEALDLRAMQAACDPLIGEHDFTSFCKRPPAEGATLTRRILEAEWTGEPGDTLLFTIKARAFCHQMVRSITGTLVDVGRGKRRAGDVLDILRARDRAAAGPPAPAHGLCLWQVEYDGAGNPVPGGIPSDGGNSGR